MNSDTNTQWQYKSDVGEEPANSSPENSPSGQNFSWTAAEYIEHQRGSGWYFLLLIGTLALAAGTYFITKDYFATGIIVVLGIIVAAYAGHKPRQVTYELSNKGLRIGDKLYRYNMFRSFFVVDEGELSSINFLPVKRFMPLISAYFAPQEQQKITDVLGDHLPYEERRLDGVDRLTRRLRF